jgi:hypothetical protein
VPRGARRGRGRMLMVGAGVPRELQQAAARTGELSAARRSKRCRPGCESRAAMYNVRCRDWIDQCMYDPSGSSRTWDRVCTLCHDMPPLKSSGAARAGARVDMVTVTLSQCSVTCYSALGLPFASTPLLALTRLASSTWFVLCPFPRLIMILRSGLRVASQFLSSSSSSSSNTQRRQTVLFLRRGP